VVAQDGTIVILSMLAGRFCENIDIAKLLLKRVKIQASTLRNRSDEYKTELIINFTKDFNEQLIEGKIKPVISHKFSWKEVEDAHQVMLDNKNKGKIVLTVDHDD
jgi:NADPH:quinone reductase-like Zn-dependent oxidoreductase